MGYIRSVMLWLRSLGECKEPKTVAELMARLQQLHTELTPKAGPVGEEAQQNDTRANSVAQAITKLNTLGEPTAKVHLVFCGDGLLKIEVTGNKGVTIELPDVIPGFEGMEQFM